MRILIAEDNPETLAMLVMLLGRRYRVDTATTGREALGRYRMAKEGGDPYGLFVFDVAMPLTLGTTALRDIRGEGDPTPAVILTALSREQRDELLEGLSGVKVLEKPFNPAELMAEVERAAR